MLLAGDVGGTNTRLGLFDRGAVRPVPRHVMTYPTAGYAGLEDMIQRFLADAGTQASGIGTAAFGVAGPVLDNQVDLTNTTWHIDAATVAGRFGIPHVRLANDLRAMAHAVAVLEPDELATLQAGSPDAHGNAALIAPGTGLGESLLHNVGGRLVPSPSEAGHADFAPRTAREIELLRDLIARHGRATYEHVISGPGLVALHRFTHAAPCPVVDPADAAAAARISAAAMASECRSCAEALDLFVSVLGAEAGNLALRSVATFGVYIGGGIAPKILPALQGPVFLEAYRGKAPMDDLVAATPVHVIMYPDPGLLGAAVLAAF